jgi:hypothetical protein
LWSLRLNEGDPFIKNTMNKKSHSVSGVTSWEKIGGGVDASKVHESNPWGSCRFCRLFRVQDTNIKALQKKHDERQITKEVNIHPLLLNSLSSRDLLPRRDSLLFSSLSRHHHIHLHFQFAASECRPNKGRSCTASVI